MKVMGVQYLKEDLTIRAYGDYLGKLETSGPGINIIPLVGHSSVRIAVMGTENRTPTDVELKRMKELGQLDQLTEIKPPRNWATSYHGGPRKLIREDITTQPEKEQAEEK